MAGLGLGLGIGVEVLGLWFKIGVGLKCPMVVPGHFFLASSYTEQYELIRVCPASYWGHPSLSDSCEQVLQSDRNGNVHHRTSHTTMMMMLMMMVAVRVWVRIRVKVWIWGLGLGFEIGLGLG